MAARKKICEGERLALFARGTWEFAERHKGKEAVAVVAITREGQLLLTEQLRKPVDARVIDLPAGLVGDEEGSRDRASTARRELEEETGYTCRSVELLARGPTSPGITSEIVSLYRAVGARRKGKGGGVAGESIKVHKVPLGTLQEWLAGQQKRGKLVDLKVWSALFFIQKNL
jgi:ADP-ribose pyrophosphatase